MTVDNPYHFNRCMKNPSFISEDYHCFYHYTDYYFIYHNKTIVCSLFYLHVYICDIFVQLTAV